MTLLLFLRDLLLVWRGSGKHAWALSNHFQCLPDTYRPTVRRYFSIKKPTRPEKHTHNEGNNFTTVTSTVSEVRQGDLAHLQNNPTNPGFLWSFDGVPVPSSVVSEMQNYHEPVLPKASEHLSQREAIPAAVPADPDEIVRSLDVGQSHWAAAGYKEARQTFESIPCSTTGTAVADRPTNKSGATALKSAKQQRAELRDFFVALFEKHGISLATTNKGAAVLPWKNMEKDLARAGLEIFGWPTGVPAPGYRPPGQVDKGIMGFNAEHTRALHEAMEAGQLSFRPLAGGSQLNSLPRIRQRENESEDEGDARPLKQGRRGETRKKPMAQLKMQTMWKLGTA
ncbi:hypothetical protein DFH06DRAFT_364416 [Mycena polygramma]|nr:hypothetical protein DFH06DRAFT_364416 [Mycena polygramma]